MRHTKRIVAILIALTLVLALSPAALAAVEIVYDTNGNAGSYGPGSELVILGMATDEGVPLSDTDVTIRITSDGTEIHYTQVKTDQDGFFRTRISVPIAASVSLVAEITAAGKTVTATIPFSSMQRLSLDGFVDYVGYLANEAVVKIPATATSLGLLFEGNVNYYNNRNTGLPVISLGINERNRDCFTLYKQNTDGSYALIGSSVNLYAPNTPNEHTNNVVDGSRITMLSGAAASTENRRDIIFVNPMERLTPGTTYKLVISGKLSGNSSATLGDDVTVYYTTENASGSSSGSTDESVAGGGGAAPGSVEATATVTEDGQAVLEYSEDAVIDALESALAANTDTLEFIASDSGTEGVGEFLFKLTENQLGMIADSGLEAVSFSTPLGTVTLPNEVLAGLSGAVSIEIKKVDGKSDTFEITLTDENGNVTNLAGVVSFVFPVEAATGASTVMTHNGTIMKNAIAKGNKAYGVTKSFSEFAITENPVNFDDMETHWAKNSVEFLAAREIVNGVAPGCFAPEQTVTRAEFLKMLTYSIDWLVLNQASYSRFSDVEPGLWYADSVAWAENAGVTQGYPDGTFGINNPITRQEMAVLLDRFAGAVGLSFDEITEATSFTDHDDIADYAVVAVYRMQQAGVIQGKGGDVFDPLGYATRAEAARMIEGLIENLVLPK